MALKYDGFISYSHAVDGKLAPAIQRALHLLAKPWYRLRALHIFRDETSLSANPALWSSIEKALSESQWFIYLASPGAAQSQWVRREIQWWLSHREPTSLLMALTEGTIQWDNKGNDFDWGATNAVPRELTGRFPTEPLWVDLSWARQLENLNIRHSQFRSAVLRLAAPLHGQAPDELDGDDVRQYRRTRRTARGAIAALVLLTVASVAAAYFAVQRSRESVSRELAMHSLQQLETDPELSLRLALHAVESAETQQAEEALRRALGESKVRFTLLARGQVWTAKYSPSGQAALVASGREVVLLSEQSNKIQVLSHREITPIAEFSRDGKLVATGSWDGKARLWEVASGRLLTEVQASPEQVAQIDFSSDGALLLTVGVSLKNMNESEVARVWDTKTGSLVAELKGHTATIASARFDPAGKRVVTGSWDKTVRLWDASSGRLLKTLIGHHDVVDAVAFSPDGDLVLSGSTDLTFRCWNAKTGAIEAISGQPGVGELPAKIHRRLISLSSSTRRALAHDGKRATVYDPHTGKRLRDLADFPSSCQNAVFNNDDRMIACPSDDGTAFVWDVETGVRVAAFRGHRGELNAVAFSPNSRTLLTSGTDNTARAWAIEGTGRDLTLGVHDAAVTSALWSANGQLVATGSGDGTARVWDAQTGALVSVLSSPGRVQSISFSADNRRLLVARYDGGGAHVWDARTGTVVTQLNIGQTESTFEEPADWSPEENIIILAVKEKLKPGEIPDLKELPDLKKLLPALQGDLLRWDGKSGQALPAINAGKGPGLNVMCGYSRAAGLACLRTDNEMVSRIWDVKTGSMISELRGHLSPVMLGTMSADGRLVAMSDNQQVEIWETRPGRLRSKIAANVTGVEFDLNGTRLVTGGGQREPVARVWESASGQLLRDLRGHTHSINSARFSPDGRLIVTASQDNTARVWRVADGRSIATLRGHRGMIFDARFSPDGTRVLTASSDGTARIYDISLAKPLGELIQLARERKSRELTPEETRQYRP